MGVVTKSVHAVHSVFRDRISMASDDDLVPIFTIGSETNRQYSRFNARGRD